MAERILILGASARAAAASARRAGFEPFCIDLFADRDTRLLADCLRCPADEYPAGLFRLAKQVPPMPWMYTGGLENYPELVGELAKERELWGNGPDVLRRVREPALLDAVAKQGAGFALSRMTPSGFLLESSAACVRKPRRSSGGSGIRFAERHDVADPEFYFQQYIAGESQSAVFFAASEKPVTLAVAVQLIGTGWLHARRFQYAGNISRPRIDAPLHNWTFELCVATELRGLFGIDFIGTHAVDVNPRYVASLEVHEFATGSSLFCRTQAPPPAFRVVGKAIYYAPHRLTVPASGPWDDSLRHVTDVWRRPDFADIPHPGDVIEAGQPVLTILAEATTEEDCLTRLKSRAAEFDKLFAESR